MLEEMDKLNEKLKEVWSLSLNVHQVLSHTLKIVSALSPSSILLWERKKIGQTDWLNILYESVGGMWRTERRKFSSRWISNFNIHILTIMWCFHTLQEQTKNLVLKNEMRTGGFATKSAAEVSFDSSACSALHFCFCAWKEFFEFFFKPFRANWLIVIVSVGC